MPAKGSLLAKAVIQVIQKVQGVAKDEGNLSQGVDYSFYSEEGLLKALRSEMAVAGLVLLPVGFEKVESDSYTDRLGSEQRTILGKYRFELLHESGESRVLEVPGEDADDSSKRVQKSSTAAFKCALRQAFLIRSEVEPDATRASRQQSTSHSAAYPRAVTAFKKAKTEEAKNELIGKFSSPEWGLTPDEITELANQIKGD